MWWVFFYRKEGSGQQVGAAGAEAAVGLECHGGGLWKLTEPALSDGPDGRQPGQHEE